ncbi:MAG: sel1 repeat family protein [Akkermansia sp.]|nr:sel1 repeat family protein [Akkermansia sp.]
MKLSSLIFPLIAAVATASFAQTSAPESSAPQHHQAAYKQFKTKLDELAAHNSFDPAPAIMIALNATNDEFCIEEWMAQAAKENNPVALNYVGSKHLFYVPDNMKRDKKVKEAVALVKKAADQKYAPAMVDYSTYMRHGVGVIKNTAGADRMLMEACRSGNFETRFSWLLQSGRLEKYEDKDRPEVKNEIARGNHHVLYYLSGKAPNDFYMLNMLTEAARMGNNSAMYELSTHLSRLDIRAGYHYLKAAAAHHNIMALSTLGEYLISPDKRIAEALGMQQDKAAGLYLLKTAACMGNTTANAMLAHLYYNGICGVEKDIDKAYKHIEAGASARPDVGFLAAQGFMLVNGYGVKKDAAKGLQLINLAARQKYPHAVAMQAYLHYRGIGVEPNGKEALFLLESLATDRRRLDVCFVYIALMYDEGGAGLDKDPRKVEYYMDHAKRALGEYAQQVFDQYKNKHNGWHLTPFDINM